MTTEAIWTWTDTGALCHAFRDGRALCSSRVQPKKAVREGYGYLMTMEQAHAWSCTVRFCENCEAEAAVRSTSTSTVPAKPDDDAPDQQPVASPDGCRWCGKDKGNHGRRWSPVAGMHDWGRPTDEQRLSRMKARRASRS